MKKIVKVGSAALKRKKKPAKAITRKKPVVQPAAHSEVKAVAPISDATGYADCVSESVDPVPAAHYAYAPLDLLQKDFEDHSAGPTFLEKASEKEDDGMPVWGYLLMALVIFGLLIYWAVS